MPVFSFVLISEIPSITPEDILNVGSGASSLASKAFDQVWVDILTQPGIYIVMVNLGLLIALFSLSLFLANIAKRMMSGDMFSMAEFIWPLLVVVLLSSHGTLLAKSLLGLRSIIVITDERISAQTIGGLTMRKARQKAVAQNSTKELMGVIAEQCKLRRAPDLERECIADEWRKFGLLVIREKAKAGDGGEGFWATVEEYWSATAESIKDATFSIVSWPAGIIVGIIFSALQVGFQWTLEIAFLLMAMVAPLAVGASLLPTQSKALFGWLSGFFAVSIMKLSFTITAGIAASVAVTAGNEITPVFLSIFLGLFAPVLTFIVGSGSGVTLFVILSTISAKLMSMAVALIAKQAMSMFRRNRK